MKTKKEIELDRFIDERIAFLKRINHNPKSNKESISFSGHKLQAYDEIKTKIKELKNAKSIYHIH